MSSLSIVSPERRIELNPFDVDAWNLLLRESQRGTMILKKSLQFLEFQARPIDQVRSFYEKLVKQFPNAGRYWKAYIDHEVSSAEARSGARSSSPSSCKQTWEYCETENKKCELGNDILYL
ncbi:unnamed protein product [Brugia timori]|uniref:Pre-mRNA-splicing factor SYF1 n=1 Tax=Brugia timori TaxID=42155 RepID=A0A0R3QT29_9BILA|nr:unnamed protein product [Brugia timori]